MAESAPSQQGPEKPRDDGDEGEALGGGRGGDGPGWQGVPGRHGDLQRAAVDHQQAEAGQAQVKLLSRQNTEEESPERQANKENVEAKN